MKVEGGRMTIRHTGIALLLTGLLVVVAACGDDAASVGPTLVDTDEGDASTDVGDDTEADAESDADLPPEDGQGDGVSPDQSPDEGDSSDEPDESGDSDAEADSEVGGDLGEPDGDASDDGGEDADAAETFSCDGGTGALIGFGTVDTGEGTMELTMNNCEPVAGLQITLSGIDLSGASGGRAGAALSNLTTNESGLVLGFDISGAQIDAGDGVLLIIDYTPAEASTEACFSEIILSAPGGYEQVAATVFDNCVSPI